MSFVLLFRPSFLSGTKSATDAATLSESSVLQTPPMVATPLVAFAKLEIEFASAPLSPLSLATWTDVTSYLIAGSWQRGRQHELNRMESGSAQVTLDNTDRAFDPLFTGGPFENVRPMTRMRLSLAIAPEGGGGPASANTYYPVFTGYIQSFTPDYEGPDEAVVTVEAKDAFDLLALADVTGSFPASDTGARVAAILDAVGWPGDDRELDVGDSSVVAKTYADEDGRKALSEIQAMEEAEGIGGCVFVNGSGKVVFHRRGRRLAAPYTTPAAVFADTGIGDVGDAAQNFPYDDVRPAYDILRVVNEAKIVAEGGSGVAQIDKDLTSDQVNGPRTLTKNLPLAADVEALQYAQATVRRFAEPEYLFDQVLFDVAFAEQEKMGSSAAVLGREISDRIRIVKTPPPVNGVEQAPFAIDVHVEKIEGQFEETAAMVAWSLTPAEETTFAVLDAAGPEGFLGTAFLAF